MWHRTMAHGRILITETLPRLDQITPRAQDEAQAVTHYRRDARLLGERGDWTRALTTGT
ncbi:hypothetical protein EDD99_5461 [Streptomyces sp. 846.5]|nr:hypothetical protein [Streptomyces sp. 846.5]TDT97336.1 hypothetical protein EDD99_5461 [Streptomyces sp. 846.5]